MDMITAVFVFGTQEIIGFIIFPMLNSSLGPQRELSQMYREILKGILERLVLYFSLINGYPQMLIAFGAMKLGTRLHTETDSEISNTYFLVGNFLSILLAMVGAVVTKTLWQM